MRLDRTVIRHRHFHDLCEQMRFQVLQPFLREPPLRRPRRRGYVHRGDVHDDGDTSVAREVVATALLKRRAREHVRRDRMNRADRPGGQPFHVSNHTLQRRPHPRAATGAAFFDYFGGAGIRLREAPLAVLSV